MRTCEKRNWGSAHHFPFLCLQDGESITGVLVKVQFSFGHGPRILFRMHERQASRTSISSIRCGKPSQQNQFPRCEYPLNYACMRAHVCIRVPTLARTVWKACSSSSDVSFVAWQHLITDTCKVAAWLPSWQISSSYQWCTESTFGSFF